jgi:hypothetical protein
MKHLLVYLALSLASCYVPAPTPPPPLNVDCSPAIRHLRFLQCDFADRFQTVCAENASKGLGIDLECVLSSGKCVEVLLCR